MFFVFNRGIFFVCGVRFWFFFFVEILVKGGSGENVKEVGEVFDLYE